MKESFDIGLPDVSIVVPTFNREKFLTRTIGSILRQTFLNFEIIIVDDGSTDKTADLVSELAKFDNRICYFKLPFNRGVSYARNKGIGLARGKYLLFLDSDDEIYPDSLTKMFNVLSENKCHFVIAKFSTLRNDSLFQIENTSNILLRFICSNNHFCLGGILWLRQFLIDFDIKFVPNLKVGEDKVLLVKALTQKCVKFQLISEMTLKVNSDDKDSVNLNFIKLWYKWESVKSRSIILLIFLEYKNASLIASSLNQLSIKLKTLLLHPLVSLSRIKFKYI